MPDTFTKVEEISWGSRLLDSIKGVLVGVILFLVAFPLLFWNEGRAVREAKGIAQGRATVVSVTSDKVDPAKEGHPIHVSGLATTAETVADPDFGVADRALRLVRDVEMYQWVEDKETREEKQTGGSVKRTTTYRYSKQWRREAIRSDKFADQSGHANPAAMAVAPASWLAGDIRVGAFTLPGQLVSRLPAKEPVSAPPALPASASGGPLSRAKASGNGYYIGDDPGQPKIGDLRVTFLAVRPMEVSVFGRQIGGSVGPHLTQSGTELFRIEPGLIPADVMLQHEAAESALFTWILRAAGFLAMLVGLALVFKPLVTVADVVPLLGSLLGAGAGVVALMISAPLTLATIGTAWLFYRPIWGMALLAAGAAVFVLLRRAGTRRAAARVAKAPAI
jgi:hypothetical protein